MIHDHTSRGAEQRITRTTTEARQGITPGVVRRVLAVSLTLVVIAFGVVALLMSAR